MRVFWDDVQLDHDPAFFLLKGKVRQNFESPGRGRALLDACRRMGLTISKPDPVTRDSLARVHREDYLDFLRDGPAQWSAMEDSGPEMLPTMQLCPEMDVAYARIPGHIIGKVGWYVAGMAAPLAATTWPAAEAAAAGAVAAAEEAAQGRSAYALTRPPGHHAYPARAAAHCVLNNAALAAEHLRFRGASRVGILDLDVHHGNGMQAIFWERPDVVTVSIHGDPGQQFPWYVGYAEERGEGEGEGANHNLVLPRGAGDERWLDAVDAGLAALGECDALVVALGFDASIDEPLNFLSITADGFSRAGAAVGRFNRPTVIVQEGGYNVSIIGDLLTRFIGGLAGR